MGFGVAAPTRPAGPPPGTGGVEHLACRSSWSASPSSSSTALSRLLHPPRRAPVAVARPAAEPAAAAAAGRPPIRAAEPAPAAPRGAAVVHRRRCETARRFGRRARVHVDVLIGTLGTVIGTLGTSFPPPHVVHELVHQDRPRAVRVVRVETSAAAPRVVVTAVREIEHLAPRVLGHPLAALAPFAHEGAPRLEEGEPAAAQEEPPPLHRGGVREVAMAAVPRDEEEKVVEGGEPLRVHRELARQ